MDRRSIQDESGKHQSNVPNIYYCEADMQTLPCLLDTSVSDVLDQCSDLQYSFMNLYDDNLHIAESSCDQVSIGTYVVPPMNYQGSIPIALKIT